MRIGLVQLNPTVGDLARNRDQILSFLDDSERSGCDLAVFPELSLTGYPPEDLLFKPSFVTDNLRVLRAIASRTRRTGVLVGFVDQKKGKLFNAAGWLQNGRIQTVYHKHHLPNYGVFDENRYFSPGGRFVIQRFKGLRIAPTICEDLWLGPGPLAGLRKEKPHLIVNLSASPYHAGKINGRIEIVGKSVKPIKAPLAYCNMVGGQDELVFDGGSFVLSPSGRITARMPQFQTGLFCVDFEKTGYRLGAHVPYQSTEPLADVEEVFEALVLGTRDYVDKNGFKSVALGVSGGIDSALVAAIAVEALGADRVTAVTMPSRYNLSETRQDAHTLAKNLNIQLLEIPIQPVFKGFLSTLRPHFKNTTPGLAEENLQARIRGTLLMALSNKFGWLILTTGNKSEMSAGYSTLYGDMAGGFAVLKDVMKTTVFELARFINRRAGRDVIPTRIIRRPPSAELRKNQRDEDSLGSYNDLDRIVHWYVEENLPLSGIVRKTKLPPAYVEKIIRMVDRSEYKRRQSPPGIKITPRAFGRDHRMPITNKYNPPGFVSLGGRAEMKKGVERRGAMKKA